MVISTSSCSNRNSRLFPGRTSESSHPPRYISGRTTNISAQHLSPPHDLSFNHRCERYGSSLKEHVTPQFYSPTVEERPQVRSASKTRHGDHNGHLMITPSPLTNQSGTI